ncbi:type II toxin-antitoxin system prevent-host-death family antitoxin [Paludisphaera sp.]|uniref:type II toxin-antitoxin system prevent-host-death family antitoxin n=1 Tax=Paludisphaera sp. TaxID=2017432 RepID=UPI00301D7D7D
MTWNLDEFKDRLTEVMSLAVTEGPQTITGLQEPVVVVSAEKYAELTGKRLDFKEYLRLGVGLDELDLTRDQGPGRDIDL